MSQTVIEVGPTMISGPNTAPAEWVSVALECIDDDLALLDEQLISVQDLWQDVIRVVGGDEPDTLVVVCPTWWPSSRTGRIQAAAQAVAATVIMLQRTALLCQAAAPRATIVESAGDLVVVTHPDVQPLVLARQGDVATTSQAVAAAVGRSTVVLIDAPDLDPLAARLTRLLRDNGIEVSVASEDAVRRAGSRSRQSAEDTPPVATRRERRPRTAATLIGVVSAAAVAVGGIAVHDEATPTALLVEGRVGMVVPADWPVRRVTSGPGSARVQIASPTHGDVALHLTQSAGGPDPGLAATADALHAALDEETDGVFADFRPVDHRAGRDAVTYREIRPNHTVIWVVLVDGSVRIAIGCQSPIGGEHLVREVCDQAIRSAHAVR